MTERAPSNTRQTRGSIRTYFSTRASSQSQEQSDTPTAEENLVRDNMDVGTTPGVETAEASMTELVRLVKGIDEKTTNLDSKLTDGFSTLNEKFTKLTNKVDALEFEVEAVKETQKDEAKEIQSLREELDAVKRSLLTSQTYARKYHLLLYGVSGHESQPKETIERVRRFATENLKMDVDFVNKVVIRNAHRLQKHGEAPATIIVVFLLWEEREAFLKAGPNLRNTKMSVRTDLPPELKRKRGELASMAYRIRQDENLQTRIREKGPDIWVDVRRNSSSPWTRRCSASDI